MLTVKSLTVQNIGRFTQPQTVDFTTLGPLVQIAGQNNNTNGSSGAGKSTVLKALEFLLGLNDIANGVLQSRLTKEPMCVSGIFDLDGQPLKIERGKKLLIDLDGEVTTGSARLSEEKLDQILGLPRDLFRKILHKRQNEQGFFLDLTPSEVHKFLTDSMGLQAEQNKTIILDSRLDILSKLDISLTSFIESAQAGLRATQSAIDSLGPQPVLELPPGGLERLHKDYVRAEQNHDSARTIYKLEDEELERTRPLTQIVSYDRSQIENLESSISVINLEMAIMEKSELNRQSDVKAKISELQIIASKLENSELTRLADIRNRISILQLEISTLQGLEQKRQAEVRAKMAINKASNLAAMSAIEVGQAALIKVAKLMADLNMVRTAVCPTCEQSWVTPAAKTKETGILLELKELRVLVSMEREASKQLPILENEWAQLSQESAPRPLQADDITGEIEQLELSRKPQQDPRVIELSYQIEQLRDESKPKIAPRLLELTQKYNELNGQLAAERKLESDHQFTENARNQLLAVNFHLKQTLFRETVEKALRSLQEIENKSHAEYEGFKNKIESFDIQVKRFTETLKRLNAQLLEYKTLMDKNTLERAATREEIELALEAKKAIRSYLSCSFDDALTSIGDAATRMIRNVPNMSTATIQLDGLKETAQGKIKQEINCVISVDGEPEVPIKSLSGGERSSLDLAIDLAVMDFIQEKSGIGTNLLLLDEPFNGLDHENISSIIELLRESGLDKQILIIDHNPIVQETFESKIVVIRDGLTSRVVQQ